MTKQSIAMLQQARSPRFARDDEAVVDYHATLAVTDTCHCEERSDEAIHCNVTKAGSPHFARDDGAVVDCRASIAMTDKPLAMTNEVLTIIICRAARKSTGIN